MADNKTFTTFGKHSFSLLASDMIGEGVAMGTVALSDTVLPETMKVTSSWLSNHVIKPNIIPLERFLSKFGYGADENNPDHKDVAQLSARADRMGELGVKLSAGAVTGWATTFGMQHVLDHAMAVPRSSKEIIGALAFDVATHVALMGIICSPPAVPLANKIEADTHAVAKPVLKALGFDDETADKKAKDIGTYMVVNGVPNIGGFLVGSGKIAWNDFGIGDKLKNWGR